MLGPLQPVAELVQRLDGELNHILMLGQRGADGVKLEVVQGLHLLQTGVYMCCMTINNLRPPPRGE